MKDYSNSGLLYTILISIFSLILLSFFRFSIKFESIDWWLVVYFISFSLFQLKTLASIKIALIENSDDYRTYKLYLFRLFESQKDNLDIPKKMWIDEKILNYSNSTCSILSSIAFKLNLSSINQEEVYLSIREDTYLELLDEKGFAALKYKSRLMRKNLKQIINNYLRFKKSLIKFDDAERDYRNGYFTSSATKPVNEIIYQSLSIMGTLSLSIYSLIKWDASILLKIFIFLLLLVINAITLIPQVKEGKEHLRNYWDSIDRALNNSSHLVK